MGVMVVAVGAVVTTTIPYRPMGPCIDGCVPDSRRYVPGRSALHVSGVVAPAATSVANDCTRGPCGGGTNDPGAPAVGQVTVRFEWDGLGTLDGFPRPPPTCPTIVSEVGIALVPVPAAKDRLLVRLIVSVAPVVATDGTVMTIGAQPAPALEFNAAHVAVEPVTAAPQV